jgi:hypothetical protein
MASSESRCGRHRNADTVLGKAAARPQKPLSGGNPQIPKGDGDAPVQACIAAMPGWKSAVGGALTN